MYTNKKSNPLANDNIYLEYVDKFLRLKDEWLEGIAV
jgi:hypothetical protein